MSDLHSVRSELHPPHPGECGCWRCAEWRLYQANLKGWDVVFKSIFGSLSERESLTPSGRRPTADSSRSESETEDVTGPPPLRLIAGGDGPDERSLDGDEDEGR
jgi:hypothetical protein